MLKEFSPGKFFLDYGPVQMAISAFNNDIPLREEIRESAEYVKILLEEVAKYLSIARLPAGKIKNEQNLPPVLQEMVKAVRASGDPTLTPMAAVAGTFADFMADNLQQKNATKVIVNNGGDIALRLADGERVRVGIVSSLAKSKYTHSIEIHAADRIGGIATSGLGGRSLTRGIASAAVTFGSNCRQADACATLIANCTYSPDQAITQVRAEKIDPDTDIKGLTVTLNVDVARLAKNTVEKALQNGISKARELCQKRIIRGALLFIDEQMSAEPKDLIFKIKEI